MNPTEAKSNWINARAALSEAAECLALAQTHISTAKSNLKISRKIVRENQAALANAENTAQDEAVHYDACAAALADAENTLVTADAAPDLSLAA
jgi:hypothetical protein